MQSYLLGCTFCLNTLAIIQETNRVLRNTLSLAVGIHQLPQGSLLLNFEVDLSSVLIQCVIRVYSKQAQEPSMCSSYLAHHTEVNVVLVSLLIVLLLSSWGCSSFFCHDVGC